MINHRSIQSIILRNVKYQLGKASYKENLPLDVEGDEKWSLSKLKVGDWLSEMQYYRLNREKKDERGRYSCKLYRKEAGPNYVIPPKQMKMMYNSSLYSTVQKVSRTELIKILIAAKECVF